MKYSNYSITVIGSGIAGLFLAYKLSLNKKFKDGVLLVTKKRLEDSNSKYAQGGIVGVLPQNKDDSVALHIKDTINSGCGINDFNVVKYISEHSASAIDDLIAIGVEFDKSEKKQIKYTLEGAHSVPRILHAGGDATGKLIDEKLLEVVKKSNNITIYENSLAIDILKDKNNDAKGVIVYKEDDDNYEAIYSGAVILATGGAGQVYKYTTNPETATGGGIILAKKAGCEISGMEFVQFHPTALNIEGASQMPLISESVRGEGAILIDSDGHDFTPEYNPKGSLAPRDVVSRAILSHLKKNPYTKIYLDITNIGLEKFIERFPTITEICKKAHINLSNNLIPVTPSAHYLMGGIKTSVRGETNIKNLYAIGECASTGLHGANRLASNSLLECVVCAQSLSEFLVKQDFSPLKIIDENIRKTLLEYDEQNELQELDCDNIKEQLKNIMWDCVGIERSENSLDRALEQLDVLERNFQTKKCINSEHYETRNLLDVAKLITISAKNRKETIGSHYRVDYIKPKQDMIKEDTTKNGVIIK